MAEEGSITKVYIQDPEARPSLKGYRNPSKVASLTMPEQYDLILFDMVGLGLRAEKLKDKGRLVIGGGTFNDKLELDREYGQRVVEKLLPEVKVPGGEQITTQKELLNRLSAAEGPKVIKPLGNEPPKYTLVSNDEGNRTLLGLVEALGDRLLPCVLQDKITGVEVSTEGWFNGETFVRGMFNHTIEYKRFMEGDKGGQTGCMGCVVWMTSSRKDRIVQRVLLPLEPLLRKVGYLGPLDVNCILTEDEIYFLEFTPRFGYDAIQALTELYKGKLFDMLWKLASQDLRVAFWEDYSIAVRLSVPPYPNYDPEVKNLQGVQMLDPPEGARSHLMLSDVMLRDGKETLAGVDGVLGCATARGKTINEAQRRVYRTIRNCVIHPDVQWRRDIGHDVERKIEQLKVWGWIDA